MDNLLKERSWLVGDGLSIADLVLLPYTRLSPRVGLSLSQRQHVRAWIARCEGALGLTAVARFLKRPVKDRRHDGQDHRLHGVRAARPRLSRGRTNA